jgi:hypothetical protein
MLARMSLLVAAAATLVLVVYLVARSRKKDAPETEREASPALEAWILDTLEVELAEGAMGLANATPEERKRVAESLRGAPDPDVVSKVEERVRGVELEYTRYTHEADAEVTLRVRYDDGKATTASKRVPWDTVPAGVREDFERRKITRVFRAWPLPWSRARSL